MSDSGTISQAFLNGNFSEVKHGSLFSGIGGFDLAAQWMGWENVFHCELNPFGRKILNHYWPESISYEDITKTDFTIHRGQIDILTGGFPCQPYSQAGKRLGKEDDRHLWPEMLRAIREITPRYIVGENVYGLVNWSGGLVFEEVQTDLEAEGYEVQPIILPACAVNAPHRRDRVWFVAHSLNGRYKTRREEKKGTNRVQKISRETMDCGKFNGADLSRTTSNTDNKLCEWRDKRTEERWEKEGKRTKPLGNDKQGRVRSEWQNFPTQPPICGRNDGISDRLDSITFPKWRNESIKAYGNAIVPQVAYQIFKAINELNPQKTETLYPSAFQPINRGGEISGQK